MVGHGILQEKWKSWKMRKTHCRTWNVVRNSEIVEKLEIHTFRTGLWQEYWKSWKMRNKNYRTWNMARNSEILKTEKYISMICLMAKKKNLKNVENETQTLYDLEYGKKQWKTWKIRNSHCRTWNMVRKLKKLGKWDTNTVSPVKWKKTLKNVEN